MSGMDDAISVISVQNSISSKEIEEESVIEKNEEPKVLPNDVSYWNLLYILVISVGSISATSIVTLIPRHNTILYPEFWYEPMILYIATNCLRFSLVTIAELYIFTKIEELISIKVFLKLFFGYSIAYAFPYCICYTTWTIFLDGNHPLPFIALCGFSAYPAYFVATWYLIPPEQRTYTEIKRKLPYIILYRLFIFVQGLELIALQVLIKILSHMEWISAILIPSFRSSNSWIMSRIVRSITGPTNEATNCLVTSVMSYTCGFFIANGLFQAKQSTIYCILSVEFTLHMRNCYQIIGLCGKIKEKSRKSTKDIFDRKKREKVFELAITELIETMIPLIYGLGYALAYFGPNAHLIRNVGSDWFGGKIMRDIQRFYLVMILLFIIDLIGMILTAACLYKFGKLNALQECSKVLRKYWWLMILQLSGTAIYFGANDVNFAMDFTGDFQWITDDGRYDLIRNSSQLSLNEKTYLLQNITLT